MSKKYNELYALKDELNRKVIRYFEYYYRKSGFTAYLNHVLLDFRKKCRYAEDDVRPLLVKLGYEINKPNNNIRHILPAMVAIHSLLLGFIPIDDILDGISKENLKDIDDFEEKIALAYSLSSKLKEGGKNILRWKYKNLPNYLKIENLIAQCIERLDGSHALEINFHRKIPLSNYSIEDYINLIDEATSVFIATSFVCGGLIAGVNEEVEKIMWDFGIELGRLCQIRDDFLDYVNSEITGKIPFADLLRKRKRFPLLITYKVGTQAEKREIDKILQKKELTLEDVFRIMEMLTSPKVKNKTREIVHKIQNKAKIKLALLPNIEPAKSILFDLVELFSEL